MSVPLVAPPAAWAEISEPTWARRVLRLFSRIGTFCLVELQKLRHDRSELLTRAIQPVLWLVVFGKTFSQIRAIPSDGVPYIDYLAPGIIAQSALFVSIFYGIMIIWERDAGVLTKHTHRNTIRLAPPLVIDEGQIDWAIDRLAETLQQVASDETSIEPEALV